MMTGIQTAPKTVRKNYSERMTIKQDPALQKLKNYLHKSSVCGIIVYGKYMVVDKRVGRPALLSLMGKTKLPVYLSVYRIFYAGGMLMADKKGKRVNTVEAVTELVKPIVENMGLVLWDVRFVKEGASWYLRIFIDKDSGITIEDCENVTRAVDQPLDELDPIEQNYFLEVSSPGIERELIKPEHFDSFLGAPVMIKLIRPDANGERDLSGTLTAHDKETVTVITNGSERVIKKKDTVYIKLDDFNL